MESENLYLSDIEAIMSHRYDYDFDYWTTPDKRLLKGSPFSAYSSALMLLDLGVSASDSVMKSVANLFFEAWRDDGRFKLYPTGSIYPCQTIHAVYLLCKMGYSRDVRIQKTFEHLLETRHNDGGWRCKKFYFGHGEETEFSNPLPTLMALKAFSHCEAPGNEPSLNTAVEFLLDHWTTKKPLGPCHYGIGKLFMQVEYPTSNYNIFNYVYTLSFYDRAKEDKRFIEAFELLKSRTQDGQIVIERVLPKLAKMSFCKKGSPSELATRLYNEILKNINK